MDLSKIFSARSITLLLFILVVLLLGTMFDVKLGPEPFDMIGSPVEHKSTSEPSKKKDTTKK